MKNDSRRKVKDEHLKPLEKENVVNGKEVLIDSEDGGVESPVVSDDDYENIISCLLMFLNVACLILELAALQAIQIQIQNQNLSFNEGDLSGGVADINQEDQSSSEDSCEAVDESDSSEDDSNSCGLESLFTKRKITDELEDEEEAPLSPLSPPAQPHPQYPQFPSDFFDQFLHVEHVMQKNSDQLHALCLDLQHVRQCLDDIGGWHQSQGHFPNFRPPDPQMSSMTSGVSTNEIEDGDEAPPSPPAQAPPVSTFSTQIF
ncbi:hypothetical protein L2E82_24728 [Cichorium intybus]|uniref:Uncharacterized protein n=1 Tax=Cichorium intybus TaxID=13427 RepID=A0ACB9E1N7_CICIN|nr:hypothetical protein L2E82_24728 [Cichorium intybus]